MSLPMCLSTCTLFFYLINIFLVLLLSITFWEFISALLMGQVLQAKAIRDHHQKSTGSASVLSLPIPLQAVGRRSVYLVFSSLVSSKC